MRIFIACADKSLRIAMLLLLDYEPDIVVVGITERLPGLSTQLETTQADVLLLEWELPCQSLVNLLADIHHIERPPKIIFLSNRPEDKEKILAAGADHFIVKNAPPDQLIPILNQMVIQNNPFDMHSRQVKMKEDINRDNKTLD